MLELHFGDFFAPKSVKVYLEQIKIIYICLVFNSLHREQERKREKKKKGQKKRNP